MKRYCLSILIIVIISGIGYGVDNAHAYNMADYWSLDAGDVWVFDRDMQVFTSETHVFAKYTGRMYVQARVIEHKAYFYQGPEGILMVGFYDAVNNQFIDFSDMPIKLASAKMNLGESITSSVIFDGLITFTITLEGVENVTVPAGTFADTLRVNIFVNDTDGTTFTVKVWLAKGVGTVKIQRVSESVGSTGCFLDCGAFDYKTGDVVVQRVISLTSYYANTTKNKVVIVPLF